MSSPREKPPTPPKPQGKTAPPKSHGHGRRSNAGASGAEGKPPPRMSIENLDFILEDQKRNKLQDKVDRHKHKNRKARHIRNESFGKTPSISEIGDLDMNVDNPEWLNAVHMNASMPRSISSAASPSNNEPQPINQPQAQPDYNHNHHYEQYEVPLQGSSATQPPPPPPYYDPSAAMNTTINGYMPWPVPPAGPPYPTRIMGYLPPQGQPQPVHPLKADHPNAQYPEFDEEYASLLQQNFLISSGYGATASPNVAVRHVPPGGPPRPRSGQSPFQPQQHHKSASLPAYNQHHQRGRAISDIDSRYIGQVAPTANKSPTPPSSRGHHRRTKTPPHIHRRAHSDNYARLAPLPQYQFQQHPQHPLLRNTNDNPLLRNTNDNKPPKSHVRGGRSRSPLPPRKKSIDNSPTSSSKHHHHRRVRSFGSNVPQAGRSLLPPSGSRENLRSLLPPSGSRENLRSLLPPSGSRENLLMAASASASGSAPARPAAHHQRSSSNATSTSGISMQSEASFMSVVSDIRKSSFYSGYNETTGKTEMHYPKENIHLSTSRELQTGWIYAAPLENEIYEDYHRQAEEAMLWEDEDLYNMEFHKCICQCPACYHGCTGHEVNRQSRKPKDPFQALPPRTFALAVEDSLYRRVLDEISMRFHMPCGLFYCGHHEDVDQPNIMIAVAIVVALFLTMGWYASVVHA